MAVPHRLPLSHLGRHRRLLGHPSHAARCSPPPGLLGRGHPARGSKLRRREAARWTPDARREGHGLQRGGADLRVTEHPRMGRARATRLRERSSARPLAARHTGGHPRAHAGGDPSVPCGALPARQHGHGRGVPVLGDAAHGARERRRDARRAGARGRRATLHDGGRRAARARDAAGRASRRRVPVRDVGPA